MMEAKMNLITSIISLVGAILTMITSMKLYNVYRNKTNANKNFITPLFAKVLIIATILYPICAIFFLIYKTTVIDKALVIGIVANLLSVVLNMSIQFYYWIKRIEIRMK